MAAKTTRQRVAAGARDRILASARRLFAERGFECTSTKDIAADAGVPSGLVFYYFDSKETLIEATFENEPPLEIVAAMRDAARQDMQDPIGAAMRAAYRAVCERQYQAFILMAEIRSSRPIAKRLRILRKNAIAEFAEFFRGQAGAGATAVQPEALAQAVTASMLLAVLIDRPRDQDAYVKDLTSLVHASLRPAERDMNTP